MTGHTWAMLTAAGSGGGLDLMPFRRKQRAMGLYSGLFKWLSTSLLKVTDGREWVIKM